MSDYPIEERRDYQAENVKRSITEEQQTRTGLADNYSTFARVLGQMYGGD